MKKQCLLLDGIYFEDVFRRYYPQLLAFVERQVGDRDLAKDFVQDVFFKLYESGVKFPSDLSLKSWLYKASRNAALDYLRHLKVRDDHQLLMAEAMMYNADVDETISEELAYRVNEAINSLPSQCRQIVRMNVIDGLKYAEISDQLGISVNTIKTQILRGYKRLRENLSDDFGPLVLLFIQYRSSLVDDK